MAGKRMIYMVYIDGVIHEACFVSLKDACGCGGVSYQMAVHYKKREWKTKKRHIRIVEFPIVRVEGRSNNRNGGKKGSSSDW